MPYSVDSNLRSQSIEEALITYNDHSFAMGNDLLVLDDVVWNDLENIQMQLGFLLMCFCTEGEASFKLSGQQRHMQKGDLLISLGEQVFREGDMSEDFHATAVLMSRSYAQDCIVGLNYMWPYLLYVMQQPVLKLSEEERTWILDCYGILCARLHKKPGRYLRESVVALTRAFYFEVCSLLDSRVHADSPVSQNRSYAIFDQFIRLVSQNFKRERSVEWYSCEMCLTPKYLSEVMKSVSGKTAGQWITTLVMIEIKTLLQNTNLSIKEIAREMNFPNQSFLGKYFKNIEGISPSDFRRSLMGEDAVAAGADACDASESEV